MGYVLPVRPIQSQQYANRMTMDSYNFASVGRVQEIKLKSDFLEEFKNPQHFLDEAKRTKSSQQSQEFSSLYQYKGYIPPNPANLSQAITQTVGKGLSINTYI